MIFRIKDLKTGLNFVISVIFGIFKDFYWRFKALNNIHENQYSVCTTYGFTNEHVLLRKSRYAE